MLSYLELCELVEAGVIGPVEPAQINGSSIDVRLGDKIIVESIDNSFGLRVVDPMARTNFEQTEINLKDGAYYMAPSEFVLAHTIEVFNLPNDISAEFRLKSSGARSGIDNSFACHCDPGWHGSALTLELRNCLRGHSIKLTYGMPIGQMIFHRHAVSVPTEKNYAKRGRYNNDATVSAVKK